MKKENQRVSFSKELIKNAALELSQEKEREDITVRELCLSAGVSRDTFYRHYKSIDDVFTEIYDEAKINLTSYFSKLYSSSLSKKELIAYLNYIKKNSLLYEAVIAVKDDIPKEMKWVEGETTSMIAKLLPDGNAKEKEVLALFIFSGLFAVMSKWISKSDEVSTAELAEFILKCSKNLMRGLEK